VFPDRSNTPQPYQRVSQPISWSASLLRRDLRNRALHLAATHHLLHDEIPGNSSSVIFGCDEQGRHGNFHPASYAAISATPQWSRRLIKVHTAHRKLRARADWQWRELDCANSSDALLMNIFCHPHVATPEAISAPMARLLGVDTASPPIFGLYPGVPLTSGLLDRTEIDLQLGNLFLEAKLTESSFQNTRPSLITRYRDLEEVFDVTRLPRKALYIAPSHPPVEDFSQLEEPVLLINPIPAPKDTVVEGYQLIRNVLAAYASDASFCVLCDGRRRDLIETWYKVLSAVHRPTFAVRLKLLTWQELACVLPEDLQQFLEAKYGIVPA
jgi:hypothetical protein